MHANCRGITRNWKRFEKLSWILFITTNERLEWDRKFVRDRRCLFGWMCSDIATISAVWNTGTEETDYKMWSECTGIIILHSWWHFVGMCTQRGWLREAGKRSATTVWTWMSKDWHCWRLYSTWIDWIDCWITNILRTHCHKYCCITVGNWLLCSISSLYQ